MARSAPFHRIRRPLPEKPLPSATQKIILRVSAESATTAVPHGSKTASTTDSPKDTGSVLGWPYVAQLLIGTMIGRLPTGMVPVALLLLVAEQGGSLATAGMLCAAYGLASALGQPALGRLVDRRGQTGVTWAATAATSLALLVLPSVDSTTRAPLFAALVLFAGATTPPMEANLRALWADVLPDPAQRRAALALDTGSQGLIFIAGPPVVAAAAALAGPGSAVIAAAVLGLAGAAIVLSARPSRTWRPSSAAPSGLLGPLRSPGLVALLVALTGTGVALGAHTVWAVSVADRSQSTVLLGLLPAALSVGSLFGGALYGRRAWPGSLTAQLTTAAVAFAACWISLVTNPDPVAAVAVSALPGLALPALVTSSFLTVDALAPPGTATEAYAWLVAAIGVGQAGGTALAGSLSAHPQLGAALPAVGAVFTVLVLTAARRRMYVPGAPVRRGRHRRVPAPAGRHRATAQTA
ncbi:MFS transporter [Streptomyces sp. NPDC058861]|uniref:MFS transporter n=1 Tax=Streptomyces sp. NPDC058861 TaxID=3346653 RepID=UPI0036B4A3D6